MTKPTRRGFLRSALFTGVGAAAAASAGAALPGCATFLNPATPVDVPDADIGNGKIVLVVDKYPELNKVGGAVTLRSAKLASPILLMQPTKGTFAATAATCTHVGCPLGFDGKTVVCPCHDSKFDFKGKVLQKPATQGLRYYDVTSDGSTLSLSLGTPGFPVIANGQVVFPFATFPELKQSCGVVTGTPANGAQPILLVANSDGTFVAVNPTCPHQQCDVNWDCDKKGFECPCHFSRFDATGAVLNGPATSNLGAYTVTADDTGVTVTVS